MEVRKQSSEAAVTKRECATLGQRLDATLFFVHFDWLRIKTAMKHIHLLLFFSLFHQYKKYYFFDI